MLDNLTHRLTRVIKKLRGEARLTEANIQDALREVRMALLEADVALPVVKDFIARGERAGARPGGDRQPHAGSGAGRRRAPRADALMGEAKPRSTWPPRPPR